MARKDVITYFLQQQQVYFEMLDDVKEIDKAYKEGNLTEEQVEAAKKDIETIKENYERLAYVILLLNQPHRKKKKEKEYNQDREIYDSLSGASKEAVLNECNDALADLKILLKDIKEKGNEC